MKPILPLKRMLMNHFIQNLKFIRFWYLFLIFPLTIQGQPIKGSAEDLIQRIIEKTGSMPVKNTVDVIKEGDKNTIVTGIATCMFATMDVLQKAVEKNCNFIIVHEPIYYNHEDKTENFKNDSVFTKKQQFIKQHHLVIWRFHDYIHRMQPDGILTGMVKKLKWDTYAAPGLPSEITIPSASLKEVLIHLREVFPNTMFSVIGNPDLRISHIRLAPGSPGSWMHEMLLNNKAVDLVLAGEAPQWESYEYARDAVQQGKSKAIIYLGHITSEESGMEYCADWLKGFIPNMPITFITCGQSFWRF